MQANTRDADTIQPAQTEGTLTRAESLDIVKAVQETKQAWVEFVNRIQKQANTGGAGTKSAAQTKEPRTRDEAFAIVKGVRDSMRAWVEHVNGLEVRQGLDAKKASAKSQAAYAVEARRLMRGGKSPEQVWVAAMDTSSDSTWYTRAAAVTHVSMRKAERALKWQDRIGRKGADKPSHPRHARWLAAISLAEHYGQIISTRPKGLPALANRKPRKSMRKGLRLLPVDWREILASRLPQWRMVFLAAALTGVRPEEIYFGVKLSIVDGWLIATVQGAKLGIQQGQDWRVMKWNLRNIDVTGIVRTVAAEVERLGGRAEIGYVGRLNTNPAAAFSKAVSNAVKRAFPDHPHSVTGYSLRHAFASDCKASGMGRAEISAALGHRVEKTASFYGHAGLKRGGGSVAPDEVKAAHPVKANSGSALITMKTKEAEARKSSKAGARTSEKKLG
ncbi:MAG: hypothetical protein V4684_06150 [Pseudomonadota bacterium]